MKANNGSGNIKERDEWETPEWLFRKLDKQYNFTFDCCATKKNSKCPFFSNDFLNSGRIFYKKAWMNPPFSQSRKMFEHFFRVISSGIAIYRCDNIETKLWQNVILPNCDWVFIFKGRINYEGFKGSSSRFPSALIGLNVRPPKNSKVLF